MEEAFIAVLIGLFLDAIGVLCALAVLPSKTLIALSLHFVSFTSSRAFSQRYWWLEPFLWLPRWLLIAASVLIYLLQLFLGAMAVSSTITTSRHHIFLGIMASLAILVAFTYGNSFARRSPVFAGWFPRGPLFGQGGVLIIFGEVQGEFLCLLSLIFSIITFIRIPSLINYVKMRIYAGKRPSLKFNSLKQQCRLEAKYALLDCIQILTRILTPAWRWTEQSRRINGEWSGSGEALNSTHPRHIIFKKSATKAAFNQLLAGLIEAPLYLALIIISPFAPWRIETTVTEIFIAHGPDAQRAIVIRQLLLSLADFGSLVMGLIMTFTWRGPGLLRSTALASTASERRTIVFSTAGDFLRDLLDLPELLMSLFVFATVWRAWTLFSALMACNTRQKMRDVIRRQFCLCLLDIPASFVVCLIFLTLWRAPNLIYRLRTEQPIVPRPESPTPLPSMSDDLPPPPRAFRPSNWHKIVWSEFMQLLIDTPFPLLAVLTLWRLPLLAKSVVRGCGNARERRNMVLYNIWLMIKDIPMGIMVICILLTGWRIPTLFKHIQNFEEGDDEHAMVFGVFLELLSDLPYFLLLVIVVTFAPWRIFDLISDCISIRKKTTTSNFKNHLSEYAWATFGDYGFILVLAISIITIFRLPTLIYHILHFSKQPQTQQQDSNKQPPPNQQQQQQQQQKPEQTDASKTESITTKKSERIPVYKRNLSQRLHNAANLTASGIILDIWVIFMICFTTIGIFHLLPLLQSVYHILRLYRRNGIGDGSEDPLALWDYSSGMRQRNYYCENEGCPLTFTLFEPAISGHFFSSIRDLPHVLFLPIKALAPGLLPFHWYIGWRFCGNATEQNAWKKATTSFLVRFACKQHDIASRETDFWSCHYFVFRTLLSLFFAAINEVSVLLLPINLSLLFLGTLGSPLWHQKTILLSTRKQGLIRAAVFLSVGIFTPIIFIVNAILLLTPCWIAFNIAKYSLVTTALIFVLTSLIMTSLWHLSYKIAERTTFEWFSPQAAYMWVFEEFIGQTVWRWYTSLLDMATTFCYPLRHLRYLLIGEILLALAVLFWVGWPVFFVEIALPTQFPARSLWLLIASQLSIILMHRAYFLVQRRWHWLSQGNRWEIRPAIALESLTPVFPKESKYGFGLEFTGVKHPSLHIQQARLRLDGKEFWAALSSAMGPFWIVVIRQSFHPFILCPTFMDSEPFSEGVTHVSARFTFGTEQQQKLLRVNRHVLRRYLERAVFAGNDPSVGVVIDYGERSWGFWIIKGRLASFKLKLSALMEALWADHPVNLLATGGASISFC